MGRAKTIVLAGLVVILHRGVDEIKNFLSKEEIVVLQTHHAARDKRKADRIKTVLLLNQGYKYSEIARILLLSDSTAREYFKQ